MTDKVRISSQEQIIIKSVFAKYFAKSDHLWVFGSRADLERRGGDLDFYIETTETDILVSEEKKTKFINELLEKIGDQKIDVVLHRIADPYSLPIYAIAKNTGVKLV